MRLDAVTAEIRPRSDWEAVDLGFAMVRRSFWRCLVVWWLAVGLPTVAAAVWLREHPMLLLVFFWWWKPAGSRLVLFELSRRLFGEEPSWKDVWKQIPKAWWRRFFYRFIWARLSPWLPVTLAIEDLEGLRGKAYKQRCAQVVRRGEGVVMSIYCLADVAAVWLGLGLFALLLMMLPEGQDSAWQLARDSWDPNYPMEIPLLISRLVVGCVMVAMSLVDVFVIGAGFGVYINNRTWIEGWDVELAFKRLAQRLGKVAIVALLFLMAAPTLHGRDSRSPQQIISEIKTDKDFTVHTVKVRVPKERNWKLPFDPGALIAVLFYGGIAAALVLLGWGIWKARHIFMIRRAAGVKPEKIAASARVVLGMEVSPETLPADIPAAAWMLWQQGRHHEALGLLYRGAISRAIELGRVEIQESDTEGDCMRRVEMAGQAVHSDYFRGLTGMWIRLAYAGISPPESEVRATCKAWPFGGERRVS